MSKVKFFACSFLAAMLAASVGLSFAQGAYPNRPVKLVVPLGPGSAMDALTRLLATAAPIKEMPSVPTFASKGYKRVNMDVLAIVAGPAGLPRDIAAALSKAMEKIVNDPKNAAAISNLGFQVAYGGPQQLSSYIVDEIKLLTEVARKANIKAE